MATKIIFIIIGCLLSSHVRAQTFAEWFAQKKTQKQYLLQQLAALQMYREYLKKGYGLASNGLGSISGYLRSEHSLHTTYYDRLRIADPVVKSDPMIKDILDWQQDILKKTKEIRQAGGMSAAEQNYLSNVGAAVLKDCDQQMNTLQNIISDHKMEMSDADRLALISKIHSAMLANYRFTSGFAGQVKVLVLSRQRETEQALVMKRIYGIN